MSPGSPGGSDAAIADGSPRIPLQKPFDRQARGPRAIFRQRNGMATIILLISGVLMGIRVTPEG